MDYFSNINNELDEMKHTINGIRYALMTNSNELSLIYLCCNKKIKPEHITINHNSNAIIRAPRINLRISIDDEKIFLDGNIFNCAEDRSWEVKQYNMTEFNSIKDIIIELDDPKKYKLVCIVSSAFVRY